MNIPCKNCLVLAICKSRINSNSDSHYFGWTILYNKCDLFEDYYNFYLTQTVYQYGKVDLALKDLFGKNYKVADKLENMDFS